MLLLPSLSRVVYAILYGLVLCVTRLSICAATVSPAHEHVDTIRLRPTLNATRAETILGAGPIFNIGIMGSGEDLLHSFFLCHHFPHASHHVCGVQDNGNLTYCGSCIDTAASSGLVVSRACGNHSVYTHMDSAVGDSCHFPQLTHLRYLETRHRGATFILLLRDPDEWLETIMDAGASLYLRLMRCFLLLGKMATPAGLDSIPSIVGNIDTWEGLYQRYNGRNIILSVYKSHAEKVVRKFFGRRDIFLHLYTDDCYREGKLKSFLHIDTIVEPKRRKHCFPKLDLNEKSRNCEFHQSRRRI